MSYVNGEWVNSDPPNNFPEAPIDSTIYGRIDANWSQIPIQTDAPNDSADYIRNNNSW